MLSLLSYQTQLNNRPSNHSNCFCLSWFSVLLWLARNTCIALQPEVLLILAQKRVGQSKKDTSSSAAPSSSIVKWITSTGLLDLSTSFFSRCLNSFFSRRFSSVFSHCSNSGKPFLLDFCGLHSFNSTNFKQLNCHHMNALRFGSLEEVALTAANCRQGQILQDVLRIIRTPKESINSMQGRLFVLIKFSWCIDAEIYMSRLLLKS